MRFNEYARWVVRGRKCEKKGFHDISANGLLVLAVHLQLPKALRN